MVAAERWRAAEASVSKACGLLASASGFALEMSLPLLEDARRLLAAAQPGAAERSAARDLAEALARAGALARAAAGFYQECVALGAPGERAYSPGGSALVDGPPVRTLGEG